MGGAHEALEHAEHIEHAGHGEHDEGGGHKGPGKGVGITMALLGVMLALCAAMVGAERTEFISTVVEQANVLNEYQAASTKYRLLMSELQQTYAVTPSRKLTEEYAKQIDALPMKPEHAELLGAIKFSTKELVALLTPRKHEVKGFVDTVDRFGEERAKAKAWADSFTPEANAHFEASEWYEKAQLASEIGIVIASVALLMASRPFWFASLAFGAAGLALIGFCWFKTHQAIERKCDASAEVDWSTAEVGEHHGKQETKACVPGAKQRILHAEEVYTTFRARWVEVGAGKKHVAVRELTDEGMLCRVLDRFGIEGAASRCGDTLHAMDGLESGELEVHGSEEEAHGAAQHAPAHSAAPGESAPAPHH